MTQTLLDVMREQRENIVDTSELEIAWRIEKLDAEIAQLEARLDRTTKLLAVLSIIEAHPDGEISLGEMAQALSVSPEETRSLVLEALLEESLDEKRRAIRELSGVWADDDEIIAIFAEIERDRRAGFDETP